jgi:hypothetical protein
MTASGRYAVFGSQIASWYVWDSQTATNVYTNTASAANGIWASADANRIVYATSISSLSLFDRTTSTRWPLGTLAPRSNPCFSGDGRFLTYERTLANGRYAVFLYDCQTRSNTFVSQAFNAPESPSGNSDSSAISADGRFVAYRSAATNIVPNDLNGVRDIFVWDRTSGATTLLSISRSLDSSANNYSRVPVFSGDGRMLIFESWASDLVSDDSNRQSDIFACNLYASSPIPLFQAAIVPGASPGQGLWITWPLIAGKSYYVQFKNSPSDAAWQTLAGGVTIVGTQGYLYDLPRGSTQRFYRVVAQ